MKAAQLRSLALGAVLAAGCFNTGPTEVGLGEEFVLAPNQTTRVTGTDLTIGFRRVVNDSRCPIDVVCVVEGSAGAQLDIFGSSAENPVTLESRSGFDVWTDGAYVLRLLEILPVPTADRPIAPDDYRVRLVVQLVTQ